MTSSLPIGIFDSGSGGLTVVKELVKILPHEDLFYYADTAHLPYGEKSKAYLIERALDIVSFFEKKNVKLIVVACHTASANALEVIQKQSPVPVLGIIEPTIEELASFAFKRIAILATKATIDSGVYQQLIRKHIPQAEIFPLACPKFVPLIEEGKIKEPIAQAILHETLKSLQTQQLDSALLGCTHYPIIQNLIRNELGPSVKLVDPAPIFALTIFRFLSSHNLLNQQKIVGQFHFFSSNPLSAQNLFA